MSDPGLFQDIADYIHASAEGLALMKAAPFLRVERAIGAVAITGDHVAIIDRARPFG